MPWFLGGLAAATLAVIGGFAVAAYRMNSKRDDG